MTYTLVDNTGKEYTGELVYSFYYPHAVRDKSKKGEAALVVTGFEQRLQSVGLIVEGYLTHFTVPRSLRQNDRLF